MKRQKSCLVACSLAALAVIIFECHGLLAQADDGFKHFDNSIVRIPATESPNAVALNKEARQRKLELHFVLETNNIKELETRVGRGETITPDEMKSKYSGNRADADRLVTWLRNQGFQIVETGRNYTDVYARATVAQIEKSLGVKMATVTYKGQTTPAATTAPKLPHDVGDHVLVIDGLQPFIRAVKHITPGKAATSGQPAYRINDVLKAYNATGVATGANQVIAILIDTLPDTNDINTFLKKNNLSVKPAQIQLKNVQGPGIPLPARTGEETLDTQWAIGTAPGATVSVYASGSLQYSYLDRALDRILEDAESTAGLRQVSISLGLREDLVSQGEIDAEHTKFLSLAAIGVTVFVSSGDAGSNPDETGHGRSPDSQVEYEACDAATVAVGGTSLTIDRASGGIISEVGWGDSGGGSSRLVNRPAWQVGYPNVPSNGGRMVPDVSLVADPNPGVFVWLKGKEWRIQGRPVGGTSWSAPVWAGFAALIAETREAQRKAPLGFLAPVLYKLQGKGFRDITAGTNGVYSAGPGWDAVTGLGVPDIRALLLALP